MGFVIVALVFGGNRELVLIKLFISMIHWNAQLVESQYIYAFISQYTKIVNFWYILDKVYQDIQLIL